MEHITSNTIYSYSIGSSCYSKHVLRVEAIYLRTVQYEYSRQSPIRKYYSSIYTLLYATITSFSENNMFISDFAQCIRV